MPIRLNLLAEAQAAEEARRRDPVKRVAWLAALICVLILVWSSSLQLKAILVNSDVSRLEGQIDSRTNEYRSVIDEQHKAADINYKIEALRRFSTNRLLQGTLLNGLQQTTVEGVQLIGLRVEQTYASLAGTKARTNENNVLLPGKPATVTERIVLTLEGADSSVNPGDQLNQFKVALTTNPYLMQVLLKTNGINLKNLASPQISPSNGKPSVNFTLECRYPDKTR